MLALGRQLDDLAENDALNVDVGGDPGAARLERSHPLESETDSSADLTVSDLEAADGAACLLGVVEGGQSVLGLEFGEGGAGLADLVVDVAAGRVWDLAQGIGGLDVVLDEGVEGVLLAEVLEEVLLPPAIEHAGGDLDWGEVAARGDDRGLVLAIVGETGDLAQGEQLLPRQAEADVLIGEDVALAVARELLS